MKIVLGVFAGANKALHPKLLADTLGAESLNQKPGRGDLRPWREPLAVATVPSGRNTIYRMGRDVKSDSQYWLSWTTRVHAVRGYNTEDTTEKTYFTGSGAPKWTNNIIGLGTPPYPTATRTLGVPAPSSAVTLSADDGVSEDVETRYYTYTYVTDQGEESAPAPPSGALACKIDDTVTIDDIDAPPTGSFTIDRIRIYRTQSGEAGATEFFFLREVSAATTSTTDDNRPLGDVLETTDWIVPPSNLKHLTAMWNGMMGAISGVGFRFCPPFAPYAWPIAYEILPPDCLPVACGAWGQNFLGLTTGAPLLMTGSAPDSLDQQPVQGQSCSAAAAVVSFDHGVVWPGEDGLSYYGEAGAKLLTAGLLTRDDWQAMNPGGMVAGIYEGAYLCFYTDSEDERRGFLIDPLNPTGIYFLEDGYEALHFDKLQDALYVLDGTSVKKWDAGAAFMTATFRSKVHVTAPVNFPWAKVTADAYPVTLIVDAGPFTSLQATAIAALLPSVLTAVGTTVRATIAVADSNPVRMPAGFLASEWQVQVDTTEPVQAVALATTAKETV